MPVNILRYILGGILVAEQNWQYSVNQQRETAIVEQLRTVIDLIAIFNTQENLQGSLTSLVTRLATIFECDRVAVGLTCNNKTKICALSHSASFQEKSNLLSGIGDAIEEAKTQESTLCYPQTEENDIKITYAHERLAHDFGAKAICTVPLVANNEIIGGITLERSQHRLFDQNIIEMLEMLSYLVSPIILLKQEEELALYLKALHKLKSYSKDIIGPSHFKKKITLAAVVFLILFFSLYSTEYKVVADANLEGSVQRVLTAPIDGFIVSSNVRIGDVVSEGEILGALDDKSLELELLKLKSEQKEQEQEYRAALGEHDRSKVSVLIAKINQIKAKVSLIEAQIKRIQMVAPFKGVVIEGDFSQSLGSPVEKGQVLFKIATLDNYRIVLKVDETEIAYVEEGDKGHLILSSLPNETIQLIVKKITPVSIAEEGKNYFRVEASINNKSINLRPGMEGIAKIEVGKRKLLWIWTHKFFDWLTIKTWKHWF